MFDWVWILDPLRLYEKHYRLIANCRRLYCEHKRDLPVSLLVRLFPLDTTERAHRKALSPPQASLTAPLRHTPSFWASRPEQIKDDGMTRLYVRTGSDFHEATEEEIIASAQTLMTRRFRKDARPLTNPDLTKAFLKLHLGSLDYEVFGVLHLNSRHRLIAVEDLFRGTVAASMVYPREIAQSVLTHRTTGVILFHSVAGHRMPPISRSI